MGRACKLWNIIPNTLHAMNREQLHAALTLLVNLQDPSAELDAMEQVTQLRRRYPVELSGPMNALNALVQMQEQHPELWANTRAYIDDLRKKNGHAPCWPPAPKERFNDRKNEYQRQLMAKRRERTGRALALENAQRAPREQLRGAPRLEFERQVQARWSARLEQRLTAARQRDATQEEIDRIRETFWRGVDAEMDDLEDKITTEKIKPPTQRRRFLLMA